MNKILTETEVKSIIALHKTGDYTHKVLARKFGVHRTSIGRILNLITHYSIGARNGLSPAKR